MYRTSKLTALPQCGKEGSERKGCIPFVPAQFRDLNCAQGCEETSLLGGWRCCNR